MWNNACRISCIHLSRPLDLAYRKMFVITLIWEDKEMKDHSFNFFYYFWLKNVYVFNLSQFLSFCQSVDGKFPAHCKKSSVNC